MASASVAEDRPAAGHASRAPLIEVDNITKHFGSVIALGGVSLTVYPGEVHCLLGDNGAGKSTLIKVLSGAHPPDGGKIFIEGSEVQLRTPKEAMARGIETIYQYTAMVPAMSIARNMFIGREPLTRFRIGPIGLMDQSTMVDHATRSLTNIDLTERSPATPVEELSGGQRQSVAIARAMYFKSKLLILDEPTNHLSVKETNKVLDYVLSLKEQGIGSIFISHNMHHIFPIADRIVAMARGEKIADILKSDTSIDELTELLV